MVSRLEELKSKSTGLYKLIVIVGKSRSGKDTLARYLNELHHVEPIISYATRPKRENEKNGREHWFISPENMTELKKSPMLAYTYNAKTGHEYCASLKDFIKASGYKKTYSVETKEDLEKILPKFLAAEGPAFLEIKVKCGAREDLGRPKEKPVENKKIFMEHLNG